MKLDCHICDNLCDTFIHNKTKITYYHCKACEYIFKSPECYQDFKAQKERYDLHTNDENDEGYQAYFQRFLDFVLPLVGKPKTALDFGCGESSILANMLNKFGIDCDYYDPIYHPSIEEEKKYDLIVSTEVFEHLHDPKTTFERLLHRLTPQGYLAIQTEFLSNEPETFQQWWYPQDPTHIVFFTAHTFRVLAEMHGCSVVSDNGKNMILLQKIEQIDV